MNITQKCTSSLSFGPLEQNWPLCCGSCPQKVVRYGLRIPNSGVAARAKVILTVKYPLSRFGRSLRMSSYANFLCQNTYWLSRDTCPEPGYCATSILALCFVFCFFHFLFFLFGCLLLFLFSIP